jgi:hypothetical protein
LKPNQEAIQREGFYRQINQQNPYSLNGQGAALINLDNQASPSMSLTLHSPKD